MELAEKRYAQWLAQQGLEPELRQELDARGVANVTPLCTDILAYTPAEKFDAMVFCFFGSMEEILAAALRQCRGTVLAVVRDDVCHRFSGAPRAMPGRSWPSTAGERLRRTISAPNLFPPAIRTSRGSCPASAALE